MNTKDNNRLNRNNIGALATAGAMAGLAKSAEGVDLVTSQSSPGYVFDTNYMLPDSTIGSAITTEFGITNATTSPFDPKLDGISKEVYSEFEPTYTSPDSSNWNISVTGNNPNFWSLTAENTQGGILGNESAIISPFTIVTYHKTTNPTSLENLMQSVEVQGTFGGESDSDYITAPIPEAGITGLVFGLAAAGLAAKRYGSKVVDKVKSVYK